MSMILQENTSLEPGTKSMLDSGEDVGEPFVFSFFLFFLWVLSVLSFFFFLTCGYGLYNCDICVCPNSRVGACTLLQPDVPCVLYALVLAGKRGLDGHVLISFSRFGRAWLFLLVLFFYVSDKQQSISKRKKKRKKRKKERKKKRIELTQ